MGFGGFGGPSCTAALSDDSVAKSTNNRMAIALMIAFAVILVCMWITLGQPRLKVLNVKIYENRDLTNLQRQLAHY